MIQTQRAARVLRPAGRFIAGQISGRDVGRYTLRTGGRIVHLRHNSRDVDILNEIFGATAGALVYRPPPRISNILDTGNALSMIDLGGNIGLFALYAMQRWKIQSLRSFEPDPNNAALLRSNIQINDAQQIWTLAQTAVSNRAGYVRFASGLLSEARLASDKENSIEVPVVDLFELDHDVDLMKMDIEGAEWAILMDPRLYTLGARVVVLEWHTRSCPGVDARGCARALLSNAGYTVVHDVPADHNGLLWAAR